MRKSKSLYKSRKKSKIKSSKKTKHRSKLKSIRKRKRKVLVSKKRKRKSKRKMIGGTQEILNFLNNLNFTEQNANSIILIFFNLIKKDLDIYKGQNLSNDEILINLIKKDLVEEDYTTFSSDEILFKFIGLNLIIHFDKVLLNNIIYEFFKDSSLRKRQIERRKQEIYNFFNIESNLIKFKNIFKSKGFFFDNLQEETQFIYTKDLINKLENLIKKYLDKKNLV